ncbi:MAG: hypothetical protein ACPL07_04255 [Candidatus Bathyarchaeia archaeon]
MSTKKIRKPHPDAIATIYGWALPKTGEILVSKRGLPNPVSGFKPNRPYKGTVKTSTKRDSGRKNLSELAPETRSDVDVGIIDSAS